MLEKIGTLQSRRACTTSGSGSFLVTTNGAIWTVDVTYPDSRPRLVNIGHTPELCSTPDSHMVHISDCGCQMTILCGEAIKFCVLKNPSERTFSWSETLVHRDRAYITLNEVYDRSSHDLQQLEIFCPSTRQLITSPLPHKFLGISTCSSSQYHVLTTTSNEVCVRRVNEAYRHHSGLSHELRTKLSGARLAGITRENLVCFYDPRNRRMWFYRFDADSSCALEHVIHAKDETGFLGTSYGMTRPDTVFMPFEECGRWTRASLMTISGPLDRPYSRNGVNFALPDIPSQERIHLVGAWPSETITACTEAKTSPFDVLDVQSLMVCSMVCKLWRAEVNTERLWHRLCIRQWGPQVCRLKDSVVTWRDFYINRYKWLSRFCLVVINTDKGVDVFQMRRSMFH